MSKRHVLCSGKILIHFLTSFVSQKQCARTGGFFSLQIAFSKAAQPRGEVR